jgi:hypothetical protein
MKRLIFFPIFLVCFLSIGQAINSASIIGKSIKLGHLEVAQKNFPREMNWVDAKKACAALGIGWRLPTKDELHILYQNKGKLGGFPDNFYWSSTEYDNNNAWYQNFANGWQFDTGIKTLLVAVRAVNNLDSSQTLRSKTAVVVDDDDPWRSQLGPKNSYTTIDFNDNNFDKTNKGKKVEADSQSKLPPNIDSALKKLTKSDAYFLLKILDKPDPQNKDGDICGTTTTGCYWCNKRVQLSKFYKSRGKELFRTLMINNFGFDLDLKSKINAIRKNGMYYCEANLTWTKYYCSRNCEYLHQKSKKGF